VQQKIGLFEYLSVPVEPLLAGRPTRLTEADGEGYDRDAALCDFGETDIGTRMTFTTGETYDEFSVANLALPLSALDVTRKTAVDGETYDDDAGRNSFATPGAVLADVTRSTRTDPETYDDDPGVAPLGVPRGSDDTRLTKEEPETYDDNSGLDALSLPQV
jgi:hypothetical protein